MKKEDALRIIISCANQYNENLSNKNLMFIYRTDKNLDKIETVFLPRNFMHLTGIKLNNRIKGSVDFYKACLKRRLSLSDFELSKDGTTEMKLNILPKLMDIKSHAKMIGEYNNSKSILITEKIIGNTHSCIGFIKENGYYIPNTALREDTRNIIVGKSNQILLIYEKSIKDKNYNLEPSYIAKNIDEKIINEAKNIIKNYI